MGKLCYSCAMVVDKVMYYVYMMGVAGMKYYVEMYGGEMYVGVLVDRWNKGLDLEVMYLDLEVVCLDIEMNVMVVVYPRGEVYYKEESDNVGIKTGNNSTSRENYRQKLLRKDLSFLNLRSRDVAQDVLGALGSNSVRGKIGGTPVKATAIGGETSQ